MKQAVEALIGGNTLSIGWVFQTYLKIKQKASCYKIIEKIPPSSV